jgi:type IV secretion system protein VirB9
VEANQAERWEVKKAIEGQGETLRTHILVTPISAGLTAGFVITTTERTYYLTFKSVQSSPIRLVRWRYPLDAAKPVAKEPGLLPDPTQPKLYHVGYELGGKKPSWNPRYVVDDGKKTYIVYPEVTLFETVPMVRLVGPNGPQLVNARQFLNVVILDQLVARAELRVGTGETAEVVTIMRGAMRTIRCPGDEACPQWPQAAQQLAQRSPPAQPPRETQAKEEPQRHVPAPARLVERKPMPQLEEGAESK